MLLSEDEITVCRNLGVAEADYLRTKKSSEQIAACSTKNLPGISSTEAEICKRLGITQEAYLQANRN
ncbi:hypothetical protein [Zhongshania sp.]|uniref:hypothetical protein n=1 Tax=Zhongshania sp. TaxID=1971902 RepID=UPI001B6F55F9|nr:hypothetical protein [Zhongshania sp.]MBQ0796252.1 hypothetical protein [Zhongshania sp.]